MTEKDKKIINPDIIRYPIITDKTTKDIENNKYYFKVTKNSNKEEIKKTIEYVFNVKIDKVHTSKYPPRTKTIGKFKGKKVQYKKAIVKLQKQYTIKLFDNE